MIQIAIELYLARDRDGSLWLYSGKPVRCEGGYYYGNDVAVMVSGNYAPNLKFSDGPVQIKSFVFEGK